MFEVLSQIKNKKLNIRKDLIKYYNEMDENYEQTINFIVTKKYL